jgi:hypothetical protein
MVHQLCASRAADLIVRLCLFPDLSDHPEYDNRHLR